MQISKIFLLIIIILFMNILAFYLFCNKSYLPQKTMLTCNKDNCKLVYNNNEMFIINRQDIKAVSSIRLKVPQRRSTELFQFMIYLPDIVLKTNEKYQLPIGLSEEEFILLKQNLLTDKEINIKGNYYTRD